MLQKLPPEILEMIAQCFASKEDLKSLSLVSRAVHSGVQRTLWSSLDLSPIQEDELWHFNFKPVFNRNLHLFKYTRELNFNSTFAITEGERCPHWRDQESAPERSVCAESRFKCLARAVETIVEVIPEGRLQKFTWGLGTCVSERILGRRGILARLQPHIRSLDLTTAGDCSIWDEIDLSPFRRIRDFRWRGPRVDDFDSITDILKTNREHLTSLELDFIDWHRLSDQMNYEPEIDAIEGILADKYFHKNIMSIGTRTVLEEPLFPALVSLSLSSAPLLGRTARAFDFTTLQSLTLRKCAHWDRFLAEILKLGVPLRLKTLEIHQTYEPQTASQGTISSEHESLLRFITSFAGLEDLFLSLVGPIDSLDLWNKVVKQHGSTLKRFVHHLCAPKNDGAATGTINGVGTPVTNIIPEIYDIPDFDLAPKLAQLSEENPLNKIYQPESIGLSCIPEVLGPMFSSFSNRSMNTSSLKLIHIRQSSPLDGRGGNWTSNGDASCHPMILLPESYDGDLSTTARYPIPLSQSIYAQTGTAVDWKREAEQVVELTKGGVAIITDEDDEIDSGYPTSVDSSPSPSSWEEESTTAPEQVVRQRKAQSVYDDVILLPSSGLREPLLRFANRAFGPDGIPSLEVIAFGDFGHGRWDSRGWENVFLVKNTKLESNGGGCSSRIGRYRGTYNFSIFWPGEQNGTGAIRNGRRGWTGNAAVDDLLDVNRHFLEACPMEPLVDYDQTWPY